MKKLVENEGSNRCLNCKGLCCSQNLIDLCSYDVWTIVRALHINPTYFVGFAELKEDYRYKFSIDGSTRKFGMVVNMKERPDHSRLCIFALDLPEPIVRCGVYSCRPIACRAYPLAFQENKVVVKPWALCPEGSCDASLVDSTYWRGELQRQDMEFCIHEYLLAKWNDRMSAQPEMTTLNFRPFFEYIFEICDQLEPIRVQIPSKNWKGIYRNWRRYARNSINPLFLENEKTEKTACWSFWISSIQNVVKEANLTHPK